MLRRKDIRDYSKSHERLLIKRAASMSITIALCKNRQAAKYIAVSENVDTIHKELFRDNGLSNSIIQNNPHGTKTSNGCPLDVYHGDSKPPLDVHEMSRKHRCEPGAQLNEN